MAIGLFDIEGCANETPALEITSPVFDKTTITFPSLENPEEDNVFEIVAKRKSTGDIYIQRATLNGKTWNSFRFPVAEFFKGGRLELELGPKPNKKWGQINTIKN
jgi:putative alpha-1,2-mannosidase